MPFKFPCSNPQCAIHIEAEREWAGVEISCPECGTMLVVPEPERRSSTAKLILGVIGGAAALAIVGAWLLFAKGETKPPVRQAERNPAGSPDLSHQPEPPMAGNTPQPSIPAAPEPTGPAFVAASNPAPAAPTMVANAAGYTDVVRPFMRQHCWGCHGPDQQRGELRLDTLASDFRSGADALIWTEAMERISSGDMPPKEEPRPEARELSLVIGWIAAQLEQRRKTVDAGAGRVVLRRLNREEYNNTIRDLIGVHFSPAEDFPEDTPAGGFDNNGGALIVSPLQMEMYLQAAREILDRAIAPSPTKPRPIKWHFEVDDGPRQINARKVQVDGRRVYVNRGNNPVVDGMVNLRFHALDKRVDVTDFRVPYDGDYIVRVRAAARIPATAETRRQAPEVWEKMREDTARKYPERAAAIRNNTKGQRPLVQAHFATDRSYEYGPPRMKVTSMLAGQPRVIAEFDVEAPFYRPREYEIRARFFPAFADVRIHNSYQIPANRNNSNQTQSDFPRPELFVDWVEIEGPVYPVWPPAPHRKIFIDSPNRQRKDEAYARDLLNTFMRRAYRRPLRAGEVESKLALFSQARAKGRAFEDAIKRPLMAVLSSPHFLFLVEPVGEAGRRRLNPHEIASRLSYFLWSTMPDATLAGLAENGDLDNPTSLVAQADRLLDNKRSSEFMANFAGQWLRLREVGANPPTDQIFPRWDDHLEWSARRESEEFFRHILRESRPVTDFLKSDYVMINERLARFYGIPGVRGDRFRKVAVPRGIKRGGLVTQASILSVTSNGTRSSPVHRGIWVLEQLLGDPPAPPPPNAGDLPQKVPGVGKTTVRERLALHRQAPQCAGCHRKIDPLGFALENYDGAGEWRTVEATGRLNEPLPNDPRINASGQLPDGSRITGIDGLQAALLHKQDDFLKCLAEKLYTYALGRELQAEDEPAITDAVETMKSNGLTLRSLIHHIVKSDLFRRK